MDFILFILFMFFILSAWLYLNFTELNVLIATGCACSLNVLKKKRA